MPESDHASAEVHARIEIEGVPDDVLHVAELHGREAISKLFEFDVLAIVREGRLDSDALIGAKATLIFERGRKQPRHIHGIVAAAHDQIDLGTQHATYRLHVVPRAFKMELHETLDIFLDKTIPEILEQLFQLAELEKTQAKSDYQLRALDAYAKRDFVVQYRETDLAFASRWMEHLGISFFFEHHDGADILIVTDKNAGFTEIDGGSHVPFRARGEKRDVYRFETHGKLLPSKILLRDYNYRTPQIDLVGAADVPKGFGSIVEYGAHFKTPEEGAKIAGVRMQEQQVKRRTYTGESAEPRFSAGHWFVLDGHPWGDMELLITEVEHHLAQPVVGFAEGGRDYTNTFRAIPRSVTFRPDRVTPRPKVHGVLTGIVDADNDTQYAELDDEGRYRVKFLYDTRDAQGVQASRPVRMMQPHAGPGYGIHFPLRPGVEVLITCVDGDPDRPIIAGTVPNPQTASPVVSKNAPRNIIRTGGNNEINIDDTENAQRIKLTTPTKGTSLQLGSPNDPISGISLKTAGHQSSASVEGSSQWTTFGLQMSAFVNLLKSGTIINIAAHPNLLGLAAVGVGMWQGLASGGLPMAKDVYKHNTSAVEQSKNELYAREADKNKEALQASLAATALEDECNLCRAKTKKLLPQAPLTPASAVAAHQALLADIAAFEAASHAADNAYLAALAAIQGRNGTLEGSRESFVSETSQPIADKEANAAMAAYDYPKFVATKTAEDEARFAAIEAKSPGAIDKATWMADEKLKWQAEGPAEDLVAAHQARSFDRLDAAARDKIPDGVYEAAGLSKPYASLSPAQVAQLKEAVAAMEPQAFATMANGAEFDKLDDAMLNALPADIYKRAGFAKPTGALTAAQKEQLKKAYNDAKGLADARTLCNSAKVALDARLSDLPPNSPYASYNAALTACNNDACGQKLETARSGAIAANLSYGKLIEENTPQIHVFQQLSNQNEQAYINHVSTGINALLAIFAFLELVLHRVSLVDRWTSAELLVTSELLGVDPISDIKSVSDTLKLTAIPIIGALPFLPDPIKGRSHRTNILGADHTTEIFGKRDLVVWSETAMILGQASKTRFGDLGDVGSFLGVPVPNDLPDVTKGKVIVMGMEAVRVLSPKEVTVTANEKVEIASAKKSSIQARPSIGSIKAASATYELGQISHVLQNATATTAASLEFKLEAVGTKGAIDLRTGGWQSLEFSENDKTAKLTATANESLALNGTERTAELLATPWKLALRGKADVVLGQEDGWRLQITNKSIDLGCHEGNALLVDDKSVTIKAADEVTLRAGTKITLGSAKVAFGDAEIESGNLVVKGMMDPAIAALKLELTAKIAAAEAAAAQAKALAQQRAAAPPPAPPPGPFAGGGLH